MVERILAGVIGAGLILVAVLIRESAVAVVLALAGAALVLFAVLQERLKSVGPKGVDLFPVAREATAQVIETRAAESATSAAAGAALGVGSAHDAEVRTASAQAAAEIRAAESPEEFAEVIGRLVDRVDQLEQPETSAERRQRIREDDRLRDVQRSYDPRRK
jgi:hypothetical protein